MTDIYGSGPHAHETEHDEVLTHEQDAVHEIPSDYEFADDHGAVITEEQGDAGDMPAEAAPARRSPFLPIAAAVVAVGLLGGVVWWQFGSSPHSASPPATTVAAPAAAPAAPAVATPPVSNIAPRTDAAPLALAAPPAPTAAPNPQTAVPAGIPVANAPATVAQAQPAVTGQTTMSAVTASAVATAVDRVEQKRIAALATRIDTLQQSLEQANQQLGQVSNMVAATVGNANNAAETGKQLQERLDTLEQQLAQIKHPAPTIAMPASLPASHPVAARGDDTNGEAAARPASHKKAHRAVRRHEEKPTAIAPIWVLRAASPGQAWVSDSASSHELKPLHVGDTLQGIGRVTAIQQMGGNWVVQGTKGKIQ